MGSLVVAAVNKMPSAYFRLLRANRAAIFSTLPLSRSQPNRDAREPVLIYIDALRDIQSFQSCKLSCQYTKTHSDDRFTVNGSRREYAWQYNRRLTVEYPQMIRCRESAQSSAARWQRCVISISYAADGNPVSNGEALQQFPTAVAVPAAE